MDHSPFAKLPHELGDEIYDYVLRLPGEILVRAIWGGLQKDHSKITASPAGKRMDG